MRSQWCREHIDETAKNCGLQKSVVADVRSAAKFCVDHSDMSECSTRTILALIRVRDDPVRERAISLAENVLKDTTPTGGKKKTRLTERQVKKLIERADREVHAELSDVSETTKSSLMSESEPKTVPSNSSVVPVVDAAPVPTNSEEQPVSEILYTTERPWALNWVPTEKQLKYIEYMVKSGNFSSRVEVVSFALDLMMIESTTQTLAAELEFQNQGLGTHCSGKVG